MIFATKPLRETVTPKGPLSLDEMFEAGNALMTETANGAELNRDPPAHVLTPPIRVVAPPVMLSRISAAKSIAKITIARAPRLQTGRFPFKGVAFKGPPLNGMDV